MFYIRTEKNYYDIDVVIDVSIDENFVISSGLSWIRVDNQEIPEIGNYYYEGKFISLNSEDYKIIENIIFEQEEVKRLEREAEEERIRQEIEKQLSENSIELPPQEINEEPKLIDPRTLPKPKAGPIIGIEINTENYNHWKSANDNLLVLIDALETKNPVVEDNVAKFNPPVEFPDGTTQSEFAFPDDTFEEYIDYLKQTEFYQKELLSRMRNYLGIPEII